MNTISQITAYGLFRLVIILSSGGDKRAASVAYLNMSRRETQLLSVARQMTEKKLDI